MMIAMSGAYEIRSPSDATAALKQATQTELAMVPLLKDLARPGLSEGERADKKQEIDRLRTQYRRETEAIHAFYRELAPKLARAERAFESKDPEIERLRREMVDILQRKGNDERGEIARLQMAFERRAQELTGNAN